MDGVLLHRFYPEWPKPSLDVALQNIEAFEDEYGMNSEEFRKAWEDGETKARGIEEGDIWISFLNARDALEPGSRAVLDPALIPGQDVAVMARPLYRTLPA